MKYTVIAVLAASVLAGSAGSSSAAIKNLGDCYNTVIAACNKKKSDNAAHACANSGMDQCDKQFEKSGASQIPAGTLAQMRAAAEEQVRAIQ